MRRQLLLLLLLLAPMVLSAQTRTTVRFGHSGAVVDLAPAPSLPYAFSSGDDGKLLVWDLEHAALYSSLQIGSEPLGLIAVHPTRSEIVVFAEQRGGGGTLVGLDWVTGERLFSAPIEGIPSVLEYSPRGSYVLATVRSFESVIVVDAQTGEDAGFFPEGFGVVSFVQFAPNEQNLMTYVPSRGEFIYWALRSGRELQTVPTLSRLQHLTLIDQENFRFLVGADSDSLVVVDNLSGATRATYPVSPIRDIRFDETSGRIYVLSETNGQSTVLAFEFRSGRLRRSQFRPQSLDHETVVLSPAPGPAERLMIAGSATGELALHNARTGRRTLLGSAIREKISDIALLPGALYLSVGSNVLEIRSDLFAQNRSGLTASSVESTWFSPGGSPRLAATPDGVVIWNTDSPGNLLGVNERGDLSPVYVDDSEAGIETVRSVAGGLLIVHRDGRVVELDESGLGDVKYEGRAVQDALRSDTHGVVTAKARSSALDSSVILVDEVTRETVGAGTDAFLTTRLTRGESDREIFAIGYHGEGREIETRLLRLSGQGLRQARTLQSVPGEAVGADSIWDTASGTLLTSLVPGEVQRIDGNEVSRMAPVQRVPARLATNGELVLAANTDGTLTIWESSGAQLVDVYIVGDDWLAIASNGAFRTSSRDAESALTLLPAPGSTRRLSDFRIALPLEQE